jgi:uncharacterized protein YjiS (DUF1127 family)
MFKFISLRSGWAMGPIGQRSHVDGAQGPQSLLGTLGARSGRLVAALARELAARRAMRSLASLDDRMLRDIGLDRGQIDHAVRRGRQAALRVDDARSNLIRWS